jgi:type I restriction enzyme S subunit
MKHKSYSQYKPSGVEWLGDVPGHWDVKRAGLGFSIQLGKMLQPEPSSLDDEQVPYLKALHVQWENIDTSDMPVMWASSYELLKYAVQKGDLLVCEGGEAGRAGMLKDIDEAVIIQNALHRVRSKTNSTLFLMYMLKLASENKWFEILCNKATIAHFTGEKFAALRIPYPPFHEQQAIASYLDHETGRIDTLIGKKQKFVELLKERRTALISRAVTKGLNQKVKMKPSGVEWLGDVPEPWDVKKFTRDIGFQEGPGIMAADFQDEGTPLLRIRNIQGKTVELENCNYLDPIKVEATWKHFKCKKGDFLISGSASTGLVCEVTDEAAGSIPYTGIIRLWPANKTIDKDFIRWIVSSDLFDSQISIYQAGSTIQHFGPEHLRKMCIPLPPLFEQQAIATFLDRETVKIDMLMDKVETAVERLKEYRSALISAAVTGKIDVREAA